MQYSAQTSFSGARADFESYADRAIRHVELVDKHLPYYIEKYNLPVDPVIAEFLATADFTKDNFAERSPEEIKTELSKLNSGIYGLTNRDFAVDFAFNTFVYCPEFNEERRMLIQKLDKIAYASPESKDKIKADTVKYIKDELSPALFVEYPYKFAREQKYNNNDFADLTFACKTAIHDYAERCSAALCDRLYLLRSLDCFKSKINPNHRDILRYRPESTFDNEPVEYDFDERESASADRCF